MPHATPPPLWGWTAPARIWLTVAGVLAAVGLLAGNAKLTPERLDSAAPCLVVDPNTATAAVLNTLPKMGPAIVARIVAARQECAFRSLEDLDARVRGIGPATMTSLRPHLQIEQPGSEPASTPRPVRVARSS